jgi:hypothetical protein
MKKCKDCNKVKRTSDFYGNQGECKECTKDRVRLNYFKNRSHYITYERNRGSDPVRKSLKIIYQREMRRRFPGKFRARNKVNNEVRAGRIIKKPCESCGNPKSQAHHTDYRKPLSIIWLCRKHHLEKEGKVTY